MCMCMCGHMCNYMRVRAHLYMHIHVCMNLPPLPSPITYIDSTCVKMYTGIYTYIPALTHMSTRMYMYVCVASSNCIDLRVCANV